MPDACLILASASPRRRELLDQLKVSYTCRPAHIDESQHVGEGPSDYVQRMAQEKAQVVAARYPAPAYAVLAADTVVLVDDVVLGKPRDRVDALDILARLSGRRHSVLTAVCLCSATGMKTEVEFMTLSDEICAAYLDTPEPWDKAGAYGIQGLAGAFVRSIKGSYSSVVGLPLCETLQLLNANGIGTALTPAASA
jgi:septum formation protein